MHSFVYNKTKEVVSKAKGRVLIEINNLLCWAESKRKKRTVLFNNKKMIHILLEWKR